MEKQMDDYILCSKCETNPGECKILEDWEEEYMGLFGIKHHKICDGLKCECHKVVKQFISSLLEAKDEEIKYLKGIKDSIPNPCYSQD